MKNNTLPQNQIDLLITEFDCWLRKRRGCSNASCESQCGTLVKDRFDDEVREFIKAFPFERLETLTPEELAYDSDANSDSFFCYVSGVRQHQRNTNLRPFQYRLYKNKDGKICYGRNKNQVIDTAKVEKRCKEIKRNIKRIVELGREYLQSQDSRLLHEIYGISMGAALKGKILLLYTYDARDKDFWTGKKGFLNIYSDAHLNRIIKAFNIKSKAKIPEEKRVDIMNFKQKHPIMKDWHLFEFAEFVYTIYPNIFEGNKSAFRN